MHYYLPNGRNLLTSAKKQERVLADDGTLRLTVMFKISTAIGVPLCELMPIPSL